jgi:hypothetical protein
MSAVPLERINWSVYCPFPRIRADAEFAFAEKSRKTSVRYSKLRGRVYTSNRYNAAMEVATLDIGTDDYLVLKHSDHDFQKGGPGKVVLSYPHLRRFVEGLQEALEMVRDDCFEEVDGQYQLTDKGANEICYIHDMFNGATIAFAPTVFSRQREDLEDGQGDLVGEPGMRMYLNGMDMYSDVTLDEYATFVAFYERFDLFATSRAAIQVGMIQMGGIPGLTVAKTSAPQPTRKPAAAVATATGLGMRKKP